MRPVQAFAGLVTSFVLLSGFTAASVAEAPLGKIHSEWSKPIQKAMAQESRKKRDSSIKLDDSSIELRAGGKTVIDVVSNDAVWVVGIDFGPEAPAICTVYKQPTALGNETMARHEEVFNITLKAAEQDSLNSKVVYYVDSGFYEQAAYLAMDWLYSYTSKSGLKVMGLSKIRAAERDGTAVLCVHDEVGYRKTFARFFKNLMLNSDFGRDNSRFAYRDGWITTVKGSPAGFDIGTHFVEEDGDTVIRNRSVSLFKIDPTSVYVSDTHTVEFSTPSGYLINALVKTWENGDLQSDLGLSQLDGSWQVEGTFRGKEINTTLANSRPLLTDLGKARFYADLIASDSKDEASYPVWSTSMDPSTLMQTNLMVHERGKDANVVTATTGSLVVRQIVDKVGNDSRATMTIGPVEMVFEKVFEESDQP